MHSLTTALTVSALTVASALPAAAQQEGGQKLSFGLQTSLRYYDNYDLTPVSAGDTTQLISNLTFGASSTTRTKSVSVDGGFGLQALDAPTSGTQTDAVNPFLNLKFQASGPSSQVTASAGWSRDDRSLTRTGNLGTQTARRAALSYAFGTDTRFGGNLGFNYDRSTFQDTASSNTRTTRFQGGLHFDISPALTLRTSASFQHNETGDIAPSKTDNTTGTLGAGIRLNGTDTLNLSATANRIEVANSGTIDGGTYSAQYVHQGAVVATSVTAATALSLQGTRTSLGVDQTHTLQDAVLSYGISVERDAQDKYFGSGHLTWRQKFDTSDYDVALSRGLVTDDQGFETLVTTAAAKVRHELNDTFSLNANLTYDASNEQGGLSTKDGTASAGIGVALGPEWQLEIGAERRVTTDTANVTSASNSVYATIGRTWVAYR